MTNLKLICSMVCETSRRAPWPLPNSLHYGYFTHYPFFPLLSVDFLFPAVYVTLDQDTAHYCLSVSENQRSVKGGRKLQSRSSRPEQFDTMPCVLGCEKFTAGRHYWDVEVEGDEGQWVVGVARESIKRKGNISFSPEEGIWAIQYPFGFILKFKTLMAPLQILKGSLEPLSKIRVSLNYEAGRVSFSDACTGTSIFTFSSACFSGERVCPFFLVSQGTTLNCC
uniref:B30.2/SPRY domain-containing protein n=1 Tax=Salvator merianae TaxID=96440 RepID=A0A8D0B4W4_SALMN